MAGCRAAAMHALARDEGHNSACNIDLPVPSMSSVDPSIPSVAQGQTASDASTTGRMSDRLNWLRAAVLGANDGIVSTAGLMLGVAGADASFTVLLTAGVAALVSGALSMAVGEYVSVSTQSDTERAAVQLEREALARRPDAEIKELAALLQQKGLSRVTAMEVAKELTQHDALAAHAEIEFGIKPGEYTNPWHAAGASALAFSLGALVPLLAILLAPTPSLVPVAVGAVTLALLLTGVTSAHLGGAPRLRAALRNAGGGLLAMGVTYVVGWLVGAQL